MFDATPSRADLIRTAFPQVRACLRLAEDAGFEPREGVNPTRFPNPQTEVLKSPLDYVYAPEAMRRTLPDGDKRGQLRPKLRPWEASDALSVAASMLDGHRYSCLVLSVAAEPARPSRRPPRAARERSVCR